MQRPKEMSKNNYSEEVRTNFFVPCPPKFRILSLSLQRHFSLRVLHSEKYSRPTIIVCWQKISSLFFVSPYHNVWSSRERISHFHFGPDILAKELNNRGLKPMNNLALYDYEVWYITVAGAKRAYQ